MQVFSCWGRPAVSHALTGGTLKYVMLPYNTAYKQGVIGAETTAAAAAAAAAWQTSHLGCWVVDVNLTQNRMSIICQHNACTAQHSTAQHSTADDRTADHSTSQHGTARFSRAWSTCHRVILMLPLQPLLPPLRPTLLPLRPALLLLLLLLLRPLLLRITAAAPVL
jgi:hypothetical protein